MTTPASLTVRVDPASLDVIPGESVEAMVSVQNLGDIVDVFTLDVDGIDPSWVTLSTSSMSLFPGDGADSTLTINVPRSSDAASGAISFAVRVTSRKDPSAGVDASCQLNIAPYYLLQAAITPRRTTGPLGRFSISVQNSGNADLSVFLEGNDPEERCRFSFEPRTLTVPPGSKRDVAVVVEPGERPLRPPSKTYNLTFSVRTQQAEVPPVALNGQFEVTPRLPRWAIPAAIASAAALVLIVVAVILLSPSGEQDTPFLLNPGQDITVGFELPELKPMRIEVETRWDGGVDSLEVFMASPDGGRLSTLRSTRQDPAVQFTLSDAHVAQGESGWKVNVKNISDSGQAQGALILRYFDLE